MIPVVRTLLTVACGASLLTSACARDSRATYCVVITDMDMADIASALDAFAVSNDLEKLNEGVAARNYGDEAGRVVIWLSLDSPKGSARVSILEGSGSISTSKLADDFDAFARQHFAEKFQTVECSAA